MASQKSTIGLGGILVLNFSDRRFCSGRRNDTNPSAHFSCVEFFRSERPIGERGNSENCQREKDFANNWLDANNCG